MSSTSCRLGDLTRTLRGRVPANTVPDPDGLRFFGIAEISARGRAAPRYVEHSSGVEDAVTLMEGDVVVGLLGNIGDATLIDEDNAGAVLGRECVALRVTSPEVLRPAWLCAWMSSEEFRSQVAQNTSGATMPRLSAKALADFTVTMPSLQKQVEIDGLVRRFDAAIATTGKTLQQLEALRAAELQLAMADKGGWTGGDQETGVGMATAGESAVPNRPAPTGAARAARRDEIEEPSRDADGADDTEEGTRSW